VEAGWLAKLRLQLLAGCRCVFKQTNQQLAVRVSTQYCTAASKELAGSLTLKLQAKLPFESALLRNF
jgi:hypothetical protein